MEKIYKALKLDASCPEETLIEDWDSLVLLQIMAIASESFGKNLNPDDIIKCDTLGKIIMLLKG